MKWYEHKRAEQSWPLILSVVVAGAVTYVLRHRGEWPVSVKELFSSALNISAIMLGFLATAKSIMFSLEDTDRIKNLRVNGQFDLLVDHLMSATRCAFALTIVSAIGIVLYMGPYTLCLIALWIFYVVATSARFYQVVSLLAYLLRHNNA